MTMNRLRVLPVLALVLSLSACAATTGRENAAAAADAALRQQAGADRADCYPAVDPARPQFLVGYGSLMQEQSRKRSMPTVDAAYPVRVQDFRRGWFAKGGGVGLETTYLGAVPQAGSRINAVAFPVTPADIAVVDKREYFYCRVRVPAAAIESLASTPVSFAGDVWIYVNRAGSIAVARADFPLVQSYVDIFVSGCLEQQERFSLPGFAAECLSSTTDWSTEWVNDRLYPRRPFIHQPRAGDIDRLLHESLPDYFRRIRFESGN